MEDCPAANMPTAQIYVHAIPKVQPKNTPPLNRLDSIRSSGLEKKITIKNYMSEKLEKKIQTLLILSDAEKLLSIY